MVPKMPISTDTSRSPQGRLGLQVQDLLLPPPPPCSDDTPGGVLGEPLGDLSELRQGASLQELAIGTPGEEGEGHVQLI